MASHPASSIISLAAPRLPSSSSASSSSSSSSSAASASKPVTHSDLEGMMAQFAKMVADKIDQQKEGLDAKINAAVKNAVDALPRAGASGSGASSSSVPASSSSVCAVAAADGDLVQNLAAAIRGAGLGVGVNVGAGDSESDDDGDDATPSAGVSDVSAGAFAGAGAKSIAAVAAANTPQRVAPLVLQLAQQYGSLSHWVHFVQWKKLRNKNECAALAEAADVLLAEGVKPDSMGLELLLRRLNGVHLADTYGDWSVCSALQWSGPNGTLLDRSSLVGALKYANQLKKLQPVPADAPKKNSNFKHKGGKRYDGDARSNPAPKAAAGAKESAQHKCVTLAI